MKKIIKKVWATNVWVLLPAFILFFFSVLNAQAATTHHFECPDTPNMDPSVNCNSGDWVASSPGSAYDNGSNYSVPSGTQYISATVVNSSNFQMYCYDGSGNPCTATSLSPGVNVDVPMTFTGSAGLYIFGNGGGGWEISDLCITDTPGDCQSSPTPPATTTTASTTPFEANMEFLTGYLVFAFAAVFIIWLFKRRR